MVARAAAEPTPPVLHPFPSKEALRRAVLDSIVLHWQGVLPRLLLAASASHDRFDAVFGELHRFFASQPDRARLVVRELFDRPAEVKKMLRGAVRPWLSAIAAYIKEGQAHGRHWEDVDPEAYVVHIMQLVVCATASASVCRVAVDPEGDARDRYDKELAPVAPGTFFKPAPAPSAASSTREGREGKAGESGAKRKRSQ